MKSVVRFSDELDCLSEQDLSRRQLINPPARLSTRRPALLIATLAALVVSTLPSRPAFAQNPAASTPTFQLRAEVDVDTQDQLDGEDARHDNDTTHLDSNDRSEDLRHKHELQFIEQRKSSGDEKQAAVADEDERHANEKTSIERARTLVEKFHAQRVAGIMAQAAKRLAAAARKPIHRAASDANDLARTARMNGEASRHENRLAHIDSNDRSEGLRHKGELRAIEQRRGPDDDKEVAVADENERHADNKKVFERERALEEKVHGQNVAAIAAGAASAAGQALQQAGSNSGGSPSQAPGPGSGAVADPDLAGRMMQAAARMDRTATAIENNAMAASNEFFKGLVDSTGRAAKFWAQKPGTVLPQIADGVVKYLNSDHNANDEKIYDDAVKTVDEIQKNPARFFGEHALDVATLGAGAAGELAKAGHAAGTASEVAEAGRRAETAAELEKAGQVLDGMANDAREFSSFGSAGFGAPDFAKIFPETPAAAPPVNVVKALDATAGNQNCFAVSLAAAKRWKTGKPYVALDHNPLEPLYDPGTRKFAYGDVPTSRPSAVKALKRNFGEGNAKNPFHGPDGLPAHAEGWPVPSSQQKIELALLKAARDQIRRGQPPTAQGLVFVDGGPGSVGHVFNARYVNNKVEFWDFQPKTPVQYRMFGNGSVIMSANGKTVSVALPWNRVFFYRLE